MDTAIVLVLIAVALVAVVTGVVMLSSRRSPARLSEEDRGGAEGDGTAADHGWQRGARGDDVVDRPAGPDAEAMGVEGGGKTTSVTERGGAAPPFPRRD